MDEIYRVPIGEKYVAIVWECVKKRYMAVFDITNGSMSTVIKV